MRMASFFTATLLLLLSTACSQQGAGDSSSAVTSGSLSTIPAETGSDKNIINKVLDNYIFQNENVYFTMTPSGLPNEGLLFVNHQENMRSGHLGHALVEYEEGKILDFYPNCSRARSGHNGEGWMEYKRSEDGGQTWSDPIVLEYSKKIFEESDHKRSVMCEKAIVTSDGTIILFCLHCDLTRSVSGETKDLFLWEPYFEPTYIMSSDGGKTWSEPSTISSYTGRIWDVKYRDGVIYVLFQHRYNSKDNGHFLYVSTDNGKSFSLRSKLPFGSYFYGTMEFMDDGNLIVYSYKGEADENNIPYVISETKGITWFSENTAYFSKKLRNPQLVKFENSYFIFGRNGNKGDGSQNFIMYCSTDGKTWDNGHYVCMKKTGTGAYSNTLLVGAAYPGKPPRVLIQASHAYLNSQTNILHWWLDAYYYEE